MKTFKEWKLEESGGAYDYLFTKDFADAVNDPHYQTMMKEIYVLNNPVANAKIKELYKITQAISEGTKIWESLKELMKNIEWDHSGDGGDTAGALSRLK